MVDGERIEFFSKNGNVLGNLRRATLGTGPADYSDIGTKVIDMSPQQTIPYADVVLTQTTVTNSTTYIISTVTDTVIGDGISISNIADAVDQVSVYYGGRLLRKKPLTVHRKERAYDTTSSVYYEGTIVPSYDILPPEFTITTSTQELVLNIENITENTEIRIVKVEATVWTGTESLLTSESIQAQFLRARPTELPDSYFYGGENMLVEENNLPLTNDEGDPLEGY